MSISATTPSTSIEDVRVRFAQSTGYDANPMKPAKPGEFASSPPLVHHSDMDTVSRPELDAKLEAIEARMDARVASMSAKMDVLMERMDARDKVAEARDRAADQRVSRIEADLSGLRSDMKTDVAGMKAETDSLRGAMGSLKSTVITTGIATVLTIILGVAAFNATVLSNMVASFESGRNTADAIAKSADQLRQAQEILEQSKKPPGKQGK